MSRLDDAVTILREQLVAAQADVEQLMAALDALRGVKGGGAGRQEPRPTREQSRPAAGAADGKRPGGHQPETKRCRACKATAEVKNGWIRRCPKCGKAMLERIPG